MKRGAPRDTLLSLTHRHCSVFSFSSLSSCLPYASPHFALITMLLLSFSLAFLLPTLLYLCLFFASHWETIAPVIHFQLLPKGWCQTGAKSQLGSETVSSTSQSEFTATGRRNDSHREVRCVYLSSPVCSETKSCVDMTGYLMGFLIKYLLNQWILGLWKTIHFSSRGNCCILATIKNPCSWFL